MSRIRERLPEFIEDVRKLWSPDAARAGGSFAPATLLAGESTTTQKENMPTDVTRSTMPPSNSKTFFGQAEEMLARFPGVNHSDLLAQLTASYLMDFKYGNKREERSACDFLNLLQAEAIKLRPAPAEPANDPSSATGGDKCK